MPRRARPRRGPSGRRGKRRASAPPRPKAGRRPGASSVSRPSASERRQASSSEQFAGSRRCGRRSLPAPNRFRLSRIEAWKSCTSCVTSPTRPRRSAMEACLMSKSSRRTAPGGRVVQPQQQPGHRRLAAAGPAQEAEGRSGFEPERHVVERVGLGVVAERDAVERDRAGLSGRIVILSGAVLDRGLCLQELLDALDAHPSALQVFELPHDAPDGGCAFSLPVVVHEVGRPQRDRVGLHQVYSRRQDPRCRRRGWTCIRRPRRYVGRPSSAFTFDQNLLRITCAEAAHRVAGRAVGLDVLHARQPFLQEAVQPGPRLTLPAPPRHAEAEQPAGAASRLSSAPPSRIKP